MTTDPLLIYGAYGYTGKLIVEHALAGGLTPVLAGRDPDKLQDFAQKLDSSLETRVFSLDSPQTILPHLDGIRCVLHAAGPFSITAPPMLEACLQSRVHYLDITGEIGVFEQTAALNGRAQAAGVMLLPGVGFDVVPSDCLAAYVAGRVEDPVSLRLGIMGLGGTSQGTTKTALESIDKATYVRRAGRLVPRPSGTLIRYFDFGSGPRRTVAVSWGDVATAYYSTGIPNITVYFPARGMEGLLRVSRMLRPLLGLRPVKSLLKTMVERTMEEGPDEQALEETRSILVAEVQNAAGAATSSRLHTPNGYKLTYLAAVDIARRVLNGEWKAGFQTPSLAFGPEYVLGLPGCYLDPE